MISLENDKFTLLEGESLGEIREINLYEDQDKISTLRKASSNSVGNNEFIEYLIKYFGLRPKYSQDLLLNSTTADLSDYSTEDLEIIEEFAVPVTSSTEADVTTKYFGTITVDEKQVTPFIVPSGIDTIKVVDGDDIEKLTIDLSDFTDFDKFVVIVTDQTIPTQVLTLNLPAASWKKSKEPERLLKDRYIRNDEKMNLRSSLRRSGNLVFDILSGNILGTTVLDSTPILDTKKSQAEWNPYDSYKLGESVLWKGTSWVSLVSNNKGGENPKISPLWDEDPIKILNKRIRIEYNISEVKSIYPDKYVILNTEEKDVNFDVKLNEGYTLSSEGITPAIEGNLEISGNEYFFRIHLTSDMTESIKIEANKSYSGIINKTKENNSITVLETPIVVSSETLPDSFTFDLSSYPIPVNKLIREDGVEIIGEDGIFIDNNLNFEGEERVYHYTANLETETCAIHVVVGDRLFEINPVYRLVRKGESVTIEFYPLDESILLDDIRVDIYDDLGNLIYSYTGDSSDIQNTESGIYSFTLRNINKSYNIEIYYVD